MEKLTTISLYLTENIKKPDEYFQLQCPIHTGFSNSSNTNSACYISKKTLKYSTIP